MSKIKMIINMKAKDKLNHLMVLKVALSKENHKMNKMPHSQTYQDIFHRQ